MHAFHNKQTSETKDQISLVNILGLISLSCLAHQQKHQHRNSLVVQRLGFSASTAVAWVACVQSLVGELRYCKSCGMAETKQTKNSNQKQPPVVLLYGGQELLPGMGTVNASPLHFSLKPSFWLIKRFTRNSVIIQWSDYTPLDSKIKLVNPKGNQPWILFGRTDAETPVLRPTNGTSRLIGKRPWFW